jgi:hypothetical protein
MEEHYEMHKENMAQLVEYVHEAIDDDCGIDIEIEDDRITMFHIMESASDKWQFYWDDDIVIDVLMKKVGLDDEELDYIQNALKKMSCISVEVLNRDNCKYSTLGFRRVAMGKYYYRLYDESMLKNEIKQIYQDVSMILYNDSVVYEYGAGAIGNLNFPGKKEYMEYRRTQGEDSIWWNVYNIEVEECDSILLFPNQNDSIVNAIINAPSLEIKEIKMLGDSSQLLKYIIHK